MSQRRLGPLRDLWRIISAVKSTSEWITITAWLGLPAAAFLVAFVNQQPLDVLLLYAMAGIAFWYIGKEEWKSSGLNRRDVPIRAVYEYPKCRDCACDVGRPGSDYDFRIRVGVLNVSTTTLRSVEVFLVSVVPGFTAKRSLAWVGEKVGTAISLKPSFDHHHVELVHSYFDTSHPDEQNSLALAEGGELDNDQVYEITLSIEADDVPAVRVVLKLDPSTRPWVFLSRA